MLKLSRYFKSFVDNKKFYNRTNLLDELDELEELTVKYKEYHLLVEKIKNFVSNNGNTYSIEWTSDFLIEQCLNTVTKNDYLTCLKYINNGK